MLNKNVCPNCGQLYDTDLPKCPLCGQAPQVVETETPVQRRRITEAERRQRRADRREAELEERRRRKDEQLAKDAEEERLLEEEEALRREEKRRRREAQKQEKLEQKQAKQPAASQTPARSAQTARPAAAAAAVKPAAEVEPVPTPVVTPGPARTKQRPAVQEQAVLRDRGRVPRVFLVLSVVLLALTLLVGGSYLLWKTGTVKLPVYDKLVQRAQQNAQPTEPGAADNAGVPASEEDAKASCKALTLQTTELRFDAAGATDTVLVQTDPEGLVPSFSSTDESVAIVGNTGLVTSVAPGSCVILVTCGDKKIECPVFCSWDQTTEETVPPELPTGGLTLYNEDMTFNEPGQSYVQTVTNVPAGTKVTWTSLNPEIATVDSTGHITAVSAGTTKVIATVGDQTGECWVRCVFD